jgi:hypothetical protein
MTNAAKEWIELGNFDSVTAASRRIGEIEGRDGDARGLFLEFYVETGERGTDGEAFRVFHYTGKRRFTASRAPTELMPDTRSSIFPDSDLRRKGPVSGSPLTGPHHLGRSSASSLYRRATPDIVDTERGRADLRGVLTGSVQKRLLAEIGQRDDHWPQASEADQR